MFWMVNFQFCVAFAKVWYSMSIPLVTMAVSRQNHWLPVWAPEKSYPQKVHESYFSAIAQIICCKWEWKDRFLNLYI